MKRVLSTITMATIVTSSLYGVTNYEKHYKRCSEVTSVHGSFNNMRGALQAVFDNEQCVPNDVNVKNTVLLTDVRSTIINGDQLLNLFKHNDYDTSRKYNGRSFGMLALGVGYTRGGVHTSYVHARTRDADIVCNNWQNNSEQYYLNGGRELFIAGNLRGHTGNTIIMEHCRVYNPSVVNGKQAFRLSL